MRRTIGRRAVLAGAAAATALAGLPPSALGADVVPALGIRLRAARRAGAEGAPVVDVSFVDAQLARTGELFASHGVSLVEAAPRDTIDTRFAAPVTRADRDAFAALLARGSIDVFFVASLRDVDDPRRDRMGVTWRKLTDLSKKYVIISAAAGPSTLAHELGHYLGLPHVAQRNNLMSYDRDGGPVFLEAAQGATMRRTARALVARGELVLP